MMINRIKKLLSHKPDNTRLDLKQEDHTKNKKKKRFSLLLKTAMIEPNELPLDNKKFISKSSSFLQLQSFSVSTPLKRSRSMFGQFYANDKSCNNDTATTTDSAIIEYYAASTTASENIIHTAAVSISSVYSTINSSSAVMKLYGEQCSENENKCLQRGIQYYEQGELEQASCNWRLAAENDSHLGMFFYGLALRHGWGCRKSPALAVRFLQKVVEVPAMDLQSDITRYVSEAKIEHLVLSIYELGEFFWHGWEVPKSVTIASYYFQLASDMGNTDAMNDLAFCFKHGHGVEKDDMKAAHLYRKAEARGNGLNNNSWIWEEQFNNEN